jgi:hypothetical protein
MGSCVRCGKLIYKDWQSQRLWCDGCRKLVDEEINGELSRPRAYYFRFYLRYNYKWQLKEKWRRD